VVQWRRRQAQGEVIIVRYADDAVLGFQYQAEAELFLSQLQERLQQFGLELNREKTRLIEFGRHASNNRKKQGKGKPETFDFLGFTHICGTSLKAGRFIVRRKTIRKRMTAKLKELKAELKQRRHQSTAKTVKWLQAVVQGYFQYHAIPGNWARLWKFRREVLRHWLRQLRQRSQRSSWTMQRFVERLSVLLPEVRLLHPYPNVRFDAKHPS
jgi:RNA-directed DNA polymerase